ncbi:hypothetical protein HOLleu_30474 [Holothuria leucospilota]|uniref:Uncharacterized protein n=1 Tax=Holothuria leucospilota TaxID=206669 RepID=A0A9Q1BKQ5_HOLLE|nr:hypothetical protein HOLleu_30474 [Holothuria leucospilota]
MYMRPLGKLLRRHFLNFHFYAHVMQIYVSFSNSKLDSIKCFFEAFIHDVREWMSLNFLVLNDSKTESLLFSSQDHLSNSFNCVKVGNEVVNVSSNAKKLGDLFDTHLSMDRHISNICKSAYSHLRNISRVRKFLSQSDTEKLVHAFISSRLYSCNSLLAGLPAWPTCH